LALHSGREADHSLPSSAEVKELVELYLHSLNTPSWRGTQGEQRDNFTFTFTETFFAFGSYKNPKNQPLNQTQLTFDDSQPADTCTYLKQRKSNIRFNGGPSRINTVIVRSREVESLFSSKIQ
jgi:hypothetical protein